MKLNVTKHWDSSDFIQTSTSPAYDGSTALNRTGYCRKCQGDMQSFGDNGKDGPLRHYRSRSTYIRLCKAARHEAKALAWHNGKTV